MPNYRSILAGFLTAACLFCTAFSQALERPSFFLILNPQKDYAESLQSLEQSGAHIRLTVPPRIIIGDISPNSDLSLAALGQVNKGRVALSDVRGLGPLALSAAMQWNKSASGTSGPSGIHSQMAGEVSSDFETPQGGSLVNGNHTLKVQWTSVDGAFLYEVQVCAAHDGSIILRKNLTDRTSIEIPLDKSDPANIYVRIRAGDRPSATDSSQDRFGPWSATLSAANNSSAAVPLGAAPQPTSPVNGYEAVGFSTVLEWTGSSLSRLQLSKFPDFHDTLVDQIVPGNEFTPPSSSLHVGDRLYWRLSSWNSEQSDWSPVRTYSILEPKSTHNDMFVNPEAPK